MSTEAIEAMIHYGECGKVAEPWMIEQAKAELAAIREEHPTQEQIDAFYDGRNGKGGE